MKFQKCMTCMTLGTVLTGQREWRNDWRTYRKAGVGALYTPMEYTPRVTWKPALLLYIWIEEAGLSNFSRRSLWRDIRRKMFCTHCQYCTQTRRRLAMSTGLRHWSPDMAVLMPTTCISLGLHPFLTDSLRGSVHYSDGHDTGKHRLAGLLHTCSEPRPRELHLCAGA